ncbi:MAG: cell wall metabolism sensor histidine kinase VicK [Streptococcus sp.]|nr:cell wall metabolism sensor histidine kinase VicK [Streptococcus sp.]
MNNIVKNLSLVELGILILLLLAAFYFIFIAIRDYRLSKNVKLLQEKINDLFLGKTSDDVVISRYSSMYELSEQINDLSKVFRLAHENLEQEKNRLASILAYMSDGVLATNRSGKIIMINEMAQEQLNLTSDEAYSMSIIDILGADNTYTFSDLLAKTPEIVLNRRDGMGEFVTLRIRFALNRRESGFISGLVAVLHDSTEQEKEERERRLFVSNVSHELRTPLTSVKSYLEALDEGALREEVASSFIKVSLDETNRMMRMISDLLNLSRIDNQVTNLEVEMINFTAFMTAILNRFDLVKNQHTVAGKFYEIVRNYPLNPIWVEIDPDKMTQVIENILNNAIKYSPDGGKITTTMRTTEKQLIVSISDEGLGIPKKDLPLIFDRFYRVDKARSRQQGGTGLGLAIAKEIVKQHRGFIWAKSEYGSGSTLTIVLPYEKDAFTEDEWEEE